ncbi:MAG: peptide chain release factor N(5)-glutamine methyltransferase [Solirubrobacteraceae bacterium]|nr:peptide chain release factor N(5)-glutamine methyltransferase [Solirubrobacteraceae bacterium]
MAEGTDSAETPPPSGDDADHPQPLRATALVRHWAPKLEAAGIDTPRLDAELLIARALELDRHRLFLDDPVVDGESLLRAEALLRHRAEDRVPVAYLLGTRWFDELELEVSHAVLVPRPETELLVELTAALAPKGATTIDVGTGSGAVAVALAVRRPDLRITASDIDADALTVARRNAERYADEIPAGIAFQHASLLGDWHGEVVVSNPPYVEETTRHTLAPELAHEPDHALFAGEDGLDVIRPLIIRCRDEGVGLVLIEHGFQQASAVRDLFTAAGYRPATQRDLAGHDRITWALREDLWPLTGDQTEALRRLA